MSERLALCSKKFEDKSLQKLAFEEVSISANDFNLTTKLNQAAGFQYGKIESELGALIALCFIFDFSKCNFLSAIFS